MKVHATALTLITLLSLVFTVWLTNSSANTQQRDRIVVKKPWPLEPVKVAAVKTKNKGTVELGKLFSEDDDWLDGLTISVANNYDKTVTSLTVDIIFGMEPGDRRPPFASSLRFGPSPNIQAYLNRDPNKVVKVGQTLELQLRREKYQFIKSALERLGYPSNIKRVELVIREVGFEDGSMIYAGALYLQDPAY
ncbi:MAG: hypothetical protein WAL47_11860, partial [Pyrinomonadaceae bacterium]